MLKNRHLYLPCVLLLAISAAFSQTQSKGPVKNFRDIIFEKLAFKDADIRTIYAFLSDTAHINIVVDPDIKISVTLRLENVSWGQIFDLLKNLYDLQAIEKEGYWYIVSTTKYWSTRIAEMQNISREKELIPLETRVFRIENVSASTISPALAPVLSPRGKVVVDGGTNSLVITEIPEQFAAIKAMIDSLDRLGKQIKISCQIVQIDQSALEEMGIDWSGTKEGGDVAVSYNMDNVGGAGAAGSLARFTWGIVAGEYNLQNRISAIISQGKGRVLDQPHIVTMDNIQSEIFSGKQIPINTQDQAGNIITQFYMVGTKLSVTPHVTKDNKVSMTMRVERSGYSTAAGGIEITTRYATTTVNVKSGDVVVIGGLVTNEKTTSEYGVPLLKDLPLLGRLFKFKSDRVATSVITIFITPEIL